MEGERRWYCEALEAQRIWQSQARYATVEDSEDLCESSRFASCCSFLLFFPPEFPFILVFDLELLLQFYRLCRFRSMPGTISPVSGMPLILLMEN